jgi:hypothetical protein
MFTKACGLKAEAYDLYMGDDFCHLKAAQFCCIFRLRNF